jgi:hypothetical protein
MDWKQLWEIMSAPDNVPIVALIPLLAFYLYLAWRQASANDRLIAQLQADTALAKTHHRKAWPFRPGWQKEVHVWPFLLRMEFLAAIIVTIILMVWSITLNAPLEEPANPNLTMNPAKAPWYFLGLQEMLVYFDPWIAGVVMPTLIIFGLMIIPYIDTNPLGGGYYTWKQRKFAISTFLFGFIILWISMIIIGTFIRGPGWQWFWPGQTWDHNRLIYEVNRDLPDIFGITSNWVKSIFGAIVVGGYFAISGIIVHSLFWRHNPKCAKPWKAAQFIAALTKCDLVPAADPNTSSHMQRIMKAVAIKQLQAMNPTIYDGRAVDEMILKMIGIGSYQKLFAPPPPPGAMPPGPPPDPAKMAAVQAKLQIEQGKQQATAAQQAADAAQAKQQSDAREREVAVESSDRAADRASRERVAALRLETEHVKAASAEATHAAGLQADQQKHQDNLRQQQVEHVTGLASDHIQQQRQHDVDMAKHTAGLVADHIKHRNEMAAGAQQQQQEAQLARGGIVAEHLAGARDAALDDAKHRRETDLEREKHMRETALEAHTTHATLQQADEHKRADIEQAERHHDDTMRQAEADRQRQGRGLTRPELAVPMAYAKRSLYPKVLASAIPDDPALDPVLRSYFPRRIVEATGELYREHRLRREIVATFVTNDVVNSLGIAWAWQMMAETGAEAAEVVRAYWIAREVTGAVSRWEEVEALFADPAVDTDVQMEVMVGVDGLVEGVSRWYLQHANDGDAAGVIARDRASFSELAQTLRGVGSDAWRADHALQREALAARGLPLSLAEAAAWRSELTYAPDVIAAARATGCSLAEAADAFFALGERLHLDWLEEQIGAIAAETRWQRWALAAVRDELHATRRELTEQVIVAGRGAPMDEAVTRFLAERSVALARVQRLVANLRADGMEDTAAAMVGVRQVRSAFA